MPGQDDLTNEFTRFAIFVSNLQEYYNVREYYIVQEYYNTMLLLAAS